MFDIRVLPMFDAHSVSRLENVFLSFAGLF